MQRLEVSGAVGPIYGSLGVKRLIAFKLMGNVLSCRPVSCIQYVDFLKTVLPDTVLLLQECSSPH